MTKIFNRRKFKKFRLQLKRESTKAEDKLWNELRDKQLGYKFRRQHGIGDFIVDFYCSELKLVIEVDGDTHNDLKIIEKDDEREKYLKNQGITVQRYSDYELHQSLEGAVYDIKSLCDKLSGKVRVEWE